MLVHLSMDFRCKIVDPNKKIKYTCRNTQTNLANNTHAAKLRWIIAGGSAARLNEMSNGLAPALEFRLHH